MALDNIANILSEEALNGDWEKLSSRIANAITEVQKLAAESKEITFNIQGDNLLVFTQRLKSLEDANKGVQLTFENMKSAVSDLSQTTNQYGEMVSSLIKKESEYKLEILDAERKISSYKKSIREAEDNILRFGNAVGANKNIINQFKQVIDDNKLSIQGLEQSLIRAKVELSALAPQIATSAKGFRSQISSIDELDARVKILTIDYSTLSEAQREADGGKSLLKDIQELSIELQTLRGEIKGNGTEMKEMQILLNKEAQLTSRLTVLKTEQAEAVAKLTVESINQNRINKLNAQLELSEAGSIEQANIQIRIAQIELKKLSEIESEENKILADNLRLRIEERTEFVRRNSASPTQQAMQIGDYKSANSGLTNLRQQMTALRAQGLEESAQYEKLKLQALELAAAQAKVAEETKVGHSAFEQFSSMFSRQILRMIGSLIIYQIIIEGITKVWQLLTEDTKKAEEETERYQKSLAEVRVESERFLESEAEKTQHLVSIVQDLNKSYTFRIDSMKELIALYPELLNGMTTEDILAGKMEEKMNSINEVISIRSEQKGLSKDVEEKLSALRLATQEQIKAQEEYNQEQSGDLAPNLIRDSREEKLKNANKAVADLKYSLDALDVTMEDNEARLNDILHPKSDFESLNQLKSKLEGLKSTLESMRLAKGITDKTKASEVDSLISQDPQFGSKLKKQMDDIKQLDELIKKIEGKQDKGRNKVNPLSPLSPTLGGSRQLAEEEYNIERQRLLQLADIERKISDDKKLELDKRLTAEFNYENISLSIAENEYKREQVIADENAKEHIRKKNELEKHLSEVQSGKGSYNSENRKIAISNLKLEIQDQEDIIKAFGLKKIEARERYEKRELEVVQEAGKNMAAITKSDEENWYQQQQLFFAQQNENLISGYVLQEEKLKESLDKRLISKKQYGIEIERLQKSEQDRLIDSALIFYKGLQDSDRLTVQQAIDVQNKINALKKQQLNNVDGNKNRKDGFRLTDPIVDALAGAGITDEDLLKAKKDFWTASVNLAKGAYDAINTIRNNSFAKEEQQLQIKMQMVQLQTQQQVQAIQASVGFAIDKQNEESKLVAQSNALQNKYQAERNAIELKKAKADKQAAESGIILNTGLAITKALPLLANPATVAIGIAEIATITALGATQYAAAASTPLPQYYMGGTTEMPTFIAGERGVELIEPIDKPAYFSNDTASIYTEKPGAKITSHTESMKVIQYAVSAVLSKERDKPKSKDLLIKQVAREVAKIIGNKFEYVGGEIAYAVIEANRSKPKINIINKVVNGGGNGNLTWSINNK